MWARAGMYVPREGVLPESVTSEGERGARARGHGSRGQDISGREGVRQIDGGGRKHGRGPVRRRRRHRRRRSVA